MTGIEAAGMVDIEDPGLANNWLVRMLGLVPQSNAWYGFWRPPNGSGLYRNVDQIRWVIRAADRCALSEAGA